MTGADVDVPGIGNVKKEYVVGGVALVAGIGGYAWWKARQNTDSAPIVLNPNDVVPSTDYQNPSPGGSSPVVVDNTAGTITTNAQWATAATEKLASYGYDPVAASSALGKYLTRSHITQQSDIETIQRAVGLFGYPPEGGPWPIPGLWSEPKPPTPDPPAPNPPAPNPPAPNPPAPKGPPPGWIYVKSGDTLSQIAVTYYHNYNRWVDILNANRASLDRIAREHGRRDSDNGHWIYPGTSIYLP